jgi:predicted acyltransferase
MGDKNIEQTIKKSGERLVSVDVFRGMTMAGMILVINPGSWKYIFPVLRHASWNGCTFADLIFPFFLFIVGMSIVLALSRVIEQGAPTRSLYLKILKRTAILFALGMFLNSFPKFDLNNFRLMGVLQRIALCYLITSVIFLHTKLRGQIIWTVALMLLYWALMTWIPVPGVGAGYFEKNANFATYFDRFFLQGLMGSYEKIGEPEGLVSTLTSLVTTLCGVLTAQFIRMKKDIRTKTLALLGLGIVSSGMGKIWAIWMPINKHLWTASYVLLTTGLALIVFAILYFLVDIKRYKKGFQPFLVFGTNAITVYVLSILVARLIGMLTFTTNNGMTYHLRSWLYKKALSPWFGNLTGSLIWAMLYILLWYGIMLIFYKRKVFIKI